MKFHSGQAKTVHIFSGDEKASGTVLSLAVRIFDKKHGKPLGFGASSSFSNIVNHFTKMVWPMAEQIFRSLGLPKRYFEVFLINPRKSISEKDLEFDNSLDVPVFLSLLSAGLQIRLPDNIVSFGHITSFGGHIQLGEVIPLMLSTAIATKSIQTVVYPAFNKKISLDCFRPSEKERFIDALAEAKQHQLKLIPVKDVAELVEAVFSEEDVVSSSFRQGFYGLNVQPLSTDNSCAKTVRFFSENLEQRFYALLEKKLLAGQDTKAKELLLTLVDHNFKRKQYPKKFGYKLLQVIQSLPPEIIRLKLSFPILPMNKCIQLVQFTQESDYEDILLLFKAISGETRELTSFLSGSKKVEILDSAEAKLNVIETEISAEALARKFGIIGSARAIFVIDAVTIKSYDEFYNSIILFFVHLIRHTRNLSDPVDLKVVGAEAFELLEKAFSREGGVQAAYSEALFGLRGGMRLVIDQMTEAFEKEEQFKYVNFVFKAILDPLDFDGKVALMEELLKRLKNHLPSEIVSQPPERYARYYDTIIRAYINSIDQVKSLFRSY